MDTKETIQRIESKIKHLSDHFEHLRAENAQLRKENEQLKSRLSEQEQFAQQMKTELNELKNEARVSEEVPNGGIHSDDVVSFNKAIDQYIDEIDRCIEWLQNN